MKILIREIPSDGLQLTEELSTADYDLPVSDYTDWKTIECDLTIHLHGDECLVQGSLSTHMKAPCGRCLDPIDVTISIPDFTHAYEIAGKESIDLTQEIREDILLNLPLAPRCELNAESRCPISGKIFQDITSGFETETRETIWGALEKLKEKK